MGKWDQTYSSDDYVYGKLPNDHLVAQVPLLPKNARLLCLNEGEGRNAVWLATQGFDVVALDSSLVAKEKALRLANENNVVIEYHHTDINDFDFGELQWDGIISIFAHLPAPLRRQVNKNVVRALKPQGLLILEAYTPQQIGFGKGGPKDPELMMNSETLSDELNGLHFDALNEIIREVNEGTLHQGPAHVIQAVARKR